MSKGVYTKTKNREGGEIPTVRTTEGGLNFVDKSYTRTAGKALPDLGPIGTPDEREMQLLRRLLPDPSMRADELFVFPVMMANDLGDRHVQRFDEQTLREFVALPMGLGPIGKSLIVAHGYELGTGGIPEGRIYHAEVVRDLGTINPATGQPASWLVGRVYMANTPANADNIANIRSGVYAFVSVGVTVKAEVDPNTGNPWGWDYYLSDDGTRRNADSGVSILSGAKEFHELSYKITLGAQYGATTGGAYKSAHTEEHMKLKTLELNGGVSISVPEEQFDAAKTAVDTLEQTVADKTAELTRVTGEHTTAIEILTLEHTSALEAKTVEHTTAIDAVRAELQGKLTDLETAKTALATEKADLERRVAELSGYESEAKAMRAGLLERLVEEAVAAGEDDEQAKDLAELYKSQDLDKIRKRIEAFVTLKEKRFAAGQQSVVTEGDQSAVVPTNEEVAQKGRRLVGALFGNKPTSDKES